MLLKEVMGGKGGLLGSQQMKAVVAGSQMKGQARKARKTITLGKSIALEASSPLTCIIEPGKSKVVKHVWAASAVSALCTSQEDLQ